MELTTTTTTISLFGNQFHCRRIYSFDFGHVFPSSEEEDYFRRPLLILNLYVDIVVVDLSKLDVKSLTIVRKKYWVGYNLKERYPTLMACSQNPKFV